MQKENNLTASMQKEIVQLNDQYLEGHQSLQLTRKIKIDKR